MPSPNALTGATIDRAADRRRRDVAWLEAQRIDPAARVLRLADAGVRAEGGAVELAPLASLDAQAIANEPVLLGSDATGPLFALDEEPPQDGVRARLIGAGGMRGEPAPEAAGYVGLRGAAQTFSQADGGLLAYAAGLLNWHRTHRFCGVCGGPTTSSEGGMMRLCGVCKTHHHPRTDPVVIMLVTDGDRVLLGRQSTWPARRYSALAGFVSPGESLEEAVAREVLEETGVLVGTAQYHSSQPWPFPYSLMLGFHVPYVSGDIAGTDDELEDARWFSRDEVRTSALGDDSWDVPPPPPTADPDRPRDGSSSPDAELLLPPRSAIARRLIEDWAQGPAEGSETSS